MPIAKFPHLKIYRQNLRQDNETTLKNQLTHTEEQKITFMKKVISTGLVAALGWFMATPSQAAETTVFPTMRASSARA